MEEDYCEGWLACSRYGEIEDLQGFFKAYGTSLLSYANPSTGNTALHMAAANGHGHVCSWILGLLDTPSSSSERYCLLSRKNAHGNTPLHWATINGHQHIVSLFVHPTDSDDQSLVSSLINVKNNANRRAVDEAEMHQCRSIMSLLLQIESTKDTDNGKEAS